MKLQKIQFKQMLLSLCSFFLLMILLCGCEKKEYVSYHQFYLLVNEAYGLEESNDSSDPIPFHEAKTYLEELIHEAIDYTWNTTYMNEDVCKQLIEHSMKLYLELESKEIDEVHYKAEIKEYSGSYQVIDQETYLLENASYEVGDYLEIDEKIVCITSINENRIKVRDVLLEEIIEDLTIDQEIEVSEDEFECGDGVEIIPYISTLSKGLNLTMKVHMADPSIELTSDFGSLLGLQQSIELGKEWEIIHTKEFEHLSFLPDLKVFSKDYLTTHHQQEKANLNFNKFKTGFELDGVITLKDMKLHPTIDIHEGKINQCGLDLSYDFSSKLEYKGKINDDLLLGSFLVPIGSSGLKIRCYLYLNINANGEISFKYQYATHSKCEYNNHQFLRVNTNTTTFTGESALKLLVGPKLSCDLYLLGSRITNFDFYGQAELKTDGTISIEQNDKKDSIYLNYGVNVYLPIIKIKMSNKESLARSLGITFEAKLVNEKQAYQYEIYHSKLLLYEHGKVEETKDSCLNISDYVLYMHKGESYPLMITAYPKGYDESDIEIDIADHCIDYEHQVIQANQIGNSCIEFKTKDEKYSIKCMVYVMDESKEEQA